MQLRDKKKRIKEKGPALASPSLKLVFSNSNIREVVGSIYFDNFRSRFAVAQS